MKCPECGYDQKVKNGMTCGGCRYQFTFNPKESATAGLTDGKFAGCIRAASSNDTAYFTRNQLYAVYCKRMKPSPAGCFVLSGVGLVVAVFTFFTDAVPISIIAAVACIAMLIGGFWTMTNRVKRTQFDQVLDKWFRQGKTIERMIDEPSLHDPPPNWSEPDIYDYGVERLLIVERDLLVDLFVKNGTHAEQRMLVIAESGYPKYLMPVAVRLLNEQPELPVFLLHDATPSGVGMRQRLEKMGLPLEGHPITDLGMSPEAFSSLKRMKYYDADNSNRELPVDAMMLPFMTMGLAAAMAEGHDFATLIEMQQRPDQMASDGGASFDFG